MKCLNSIKHTQVSGEGAMYYLFKLMYTNTVITNCFMLYYSVFMSIDKIKYNNTLSQINTTKTNIQCPVLQSMSIKVETVILPPHKIHKT